jgi:hypothetical protein
MRSISQRIPTPSKLQCVVPVGSVSPASFARQSRLALRSLQRVVEKRRDFRHEAAAPAERMCPSPARLVFGRAAELERSAHQTGYVLGKIEQLELALADAVVENPAFICTLRRILRFIPNSA